MSRQEGSCYSLQKKRRKIDHIFYSDIIIEISKFINNFKDYFNLAQVNKYFYEVMTAEKNTSLNQLFKNNILKLKNNTLIPNYLFNLNYLNIRTSLGDINFYQKLIKLKYLKINSKSLILTNNYFKNMTNLEELYFINNSEHITGQFLQKFKNLKTLELGFNYKIVDSDLMELNNLTKLDIRFIYNINGSCFKNLINLTSLKANASYIKMEYLNYLINLKELVINNAKKFTLNLQNLETLQIMPRSEIIDENLYNLKNLKSLQISSCDSFLGNCFIYLQKLEYLKVSYCKINEENLQYLTNLKTLITENTYQSISGKYFNYLKKLKKLKFYPNSKFKDEYLKDLINLQSLSIPFNSKFTGKYLNNNLTKLNASNTKINEKYLFHLTKLKKLNLSDCKDISGNCFKYLTSLQKLNLNNVHLLTERHLDNLINLTELTIDNIYFGLFLLKMNNLQNLAPERSCIDFKEKEILEMKELIRKGNKFNEAVKIIRDQLEKEGIPREYLTYITNDSNDDDEDVEF